MQKYALISECGRHRYMLSRVWDETKPMVMFIGLNPSRANHIINDPTITRCERFAASWGYGGMYFANLYSWRTPDPKNLVKHLTEAVGPFCNANLQYMISFCELVVCAWGSWKFIDSRVKEVLALVDDPYCLGLNKDGQPKHPLYLKASSQPTKYLVK